VIKIPPAGQCDVEALAVLMEDLDGFYGSTNIEPPGQRVRQIAESLFTKPVAAYVLLAWEDKQPVAWLRIHFSDRLRV
jgi:hypothetical protein